MIGFKLNWGSNQFNGTAMPTLYWGARAILEAGRIHTERLGYRRNRKGEIVREYKGGPPVWKFKETVIPARLDFLPDRRGWAGSLYEAEGWNNLQTRAEFQCFRQWLEKVAMPALDKWIQHERPPQFEIADSVAKYHMRASTCDHSGYCYIGAWRE